MPKKKLIEIVLDVETTGLDYRREKIIEFAAVKLENGVIKGKFETLINPQQHIRKSSIAVHGITEDMIQDSPKESEIIGEILDFIKDYPMVAHNAIFDYSFLNEASLRHFDKELKNPRIDTQIMFKEVFPEHESCGLESLMRQFNIEFTTRHRAMADTIGLAMAYPELKKLFEQKYDWQMKQLDNINYLFERYLRVQQTISTLQSEIQDLKSVFKLHFEKGGQPITATTGETLVYHSKQEFGYDFSLIKDTLDEIGALEKAVKLNNGFVNRLVSGFSLSEETRDKIKQARQDFSETRNVSVIKGDKK